MKTIKFNFGKKDKNSKILNILPFADSEDLLELAKDVLEGNLDLELEVLLPFMDEEDVDKLIGIIVKQYPDFYCDMEKLLPFASEDGAEKLFLAEAAKGKLLKSALPFVSEECLGKFAEEYAKNPNENLDIECLFPFMDSKDLAKLTLTAIKHALPFDVSKVFQYLDEEDVDKLTEVLFEEGENAYGLDIENVIPFASEETVDKIFLKNIKNEDLRNSVLPFVSDGALHRFVVEYCKNPQNDVDIDMLYPYLEDEDISMLIKCYIKQRKKN